MSITRGLIVAAPWIDHILEGRKDWEMRSTPTSVRGWFGLIRKGSGQVHGLARLVDCGRSLTPCEMVANYEHHRIPEHMIRSGDVAKWTVPWKLADIIPLETPVPYEHKSGAVTWVTLSEDVGEQVARCLPGSNATLAPCVSNRTREIPEADIKTVKPSVSKEAPTRRWPVTSGPVGPLPDPEGELLGRSRLTEGNLRHNHFYLTDFMDRFPIDTIGGRNRAEAAARQISIDWGGASPILSDIDRTKRMFRKRKWVGQFFSASGAKEGDDVVVTSPTAYSIAVRLERRSGG